MGRVDGRVHRRIRSRSEAMVGAMQDMRCLGIGGFSAHPVRGSTGPSNEESHGIPSRMAVVASTGHHRDRPHPSPSDGDRHAADTHVDVV
jgi:hypothetical protein